MFHKYRRDNTLLFLKILIYIADFHYISTTTTYPKERNPNWKGGLTQHANELTKDCECGCGEKIHNRDKAGRLIRFKQGHYTRKNPPQLGQKHFNWKNGTRICGGYKQIIQKGHPRADDHGYVFLHILVMEKYLGRYIKPSEVVHHMNNIRTDNRLANLKLLDNQSEHIKIHNQKKIN